MFRRPSDLADEAVADVVRRSWPIEVDHVEYAPVGFGSHHWHVAGADRRWFATVDDIDARLVSRGDSRSAAHARLVAALSTAVSLRALGCEFVVAPVASNAGRVVEPIDDRFVLAVYPHVDGAAGAFGPFGNPADRLAVVDALVRLHDVGTELPARSFDFTIPARDRLVQAVDVRNEPWSTGPYGEATRELLRRHHEPLGRVLVGYDALVAVVRSRRLPPVITHGEPHPGNVIVAADGLRLVDWDTTLQAPAERDLWRLIDEDPEARDRYERTSRRRLDDDALRLFALWWDLCEIALFVDLFRRDHGATPDTRTAWQGLRHHLDPRRWADVG